MLFMKSIILLVLLSGIVSSKILNNEYQKQSQRQIDTPTMLWLDGCGWDGKCSKCLVVGFESGSDFACLNQKYSETECILEGNFLTGGTRVFVSSEQCLNGGDMDNIQVKVTFFMHILHTSNLIIVFHICILNSKIKWLHSVQE